MEAVNSGLTTCVAGSMFSIKLFVTNAPEEVNLITNAALIAGMLYRPIASPTMNVAIEP